MDHHRTRQLKKSCHSALLLILILVAATLWGCSSPTNEDSPDVAAQSTPTNPIDQGKITFAKNCAGCHGVNGEGQPDWHIRNADGSLPAPPLNGDGHTWHHSDGLLYTIVRDGGAELSLPGYKTVMPSFSEILSHQEIVAVLTYVKSLWEGKSSRGLSISESQAFASQQDPFPQQ